MSHIRPFALVHIHSLIYTRTAQTHSVADRVLALCLVRQEEGMTGAVRFAANPLSGCLVATTTGSRTARDRMGEWVGGVGRGSG